MFNLGLLHWSSEKISWMTNYLKELLGVCDFLFICSIGETILTQVQDIEPFHIYCCTNHISFSDKLRYIQPSCIYFICHGEITQTQGLHIRWRPGWTSKKLGVAGTGRYHWCSTLGKVVIRVEVPKQKLFQSILLLFGKEVVQGTMAHPPRTISTY